MSTIPSDEAMLLYPGKVPGAVGEERSDTPTLRVFSPPAGVKASGASMVICPGGGYRALGPTGPVVAAEWMAKLGITAFLLKYRHGPVYHHPIPLMDAARAVRLVRARSGQWKLDAGRVGIFGLSAGGHLAATLATHFDDAPKPVGDAADQVSARPDVHVPLCPVITMGPGGHAISRLHLLGENPSWELMASLSLETQVTPRTPPAFVAHSTEDENVPVGHSDLYVAALRRQGVEVEYERGAAGPHGIGMREPWFTKLAAWLVKKGYAGARGGT